MAKAAPESFSPAQCRSGVDRSDGGRYVSAVVSIPSDRFIAFGTPEQKDRLYQ